jgi:3'-phosphoadenosine 5'-phosphosulfate (PAPS) 3'-phosphatase
VAAASGLAAPAALRRVPAAAVCVLVDPLDGTKEFVDGRLQSVQTLIGVSVYGRAVAGVMGLPFHGDWQHVSSPVQVSSACPWPIAIAVHQLKIPKSS